MKFRIYKTKSEGFKPFYDAKYDEVRKCFTIEVNSIEELLTICDIAGHELVIGYEDEPYIEIYNGPREGAESPEVFESCDHLALFSAVAN